MQVFRVRDKLHITSDLPDILLEVCRRLDLPEKTWVIVKKIKRLSTRIFA